MNFYRVLWHAIAMLIYKLGIGVLVYMKEALIPVWQTGFSQITVSSIVNKDKNTCMFPEFVSNDGNNS